MTYFYPNHLTYNDKTFLQKVFNRKSSEYYYELNSPQLVGKSLSISHYSLPETLNYDIYD